MKSAVSAGLAGLYRTLISQQTGNGMVDAAKIADTESNISKNNAAIAKDAAETDKITRRTNDLSNPEFLRSVMEGFLPNATPEARAFSTAQSLRITDDPQRMTGAYGESLNQSYFNQALTDPNFAKQFNTANAAKGGKLYDAVGSTGMTLSQADGSQIVGNKEQFGNNQAKTISETGKNNAYAGQAQSATALNEFRINQPQKVIGYDSNGGMVLVDKVTGTGSPVTGQGGSKVVGRPTPKLPPAVLKMQQENLTEIGAAAGINAQLTRVEKQIETGKLRLSPMDRAAAFARNNTNNSNEESRNLASFQAALEKMRNDSLRLNTGVQTDGDAKRAWGELMANINDTELVKQRIKEIKEINNRAIELRKQQIELLRQNFNQPQLDNYGVDVGGYQQDSQVYDFNQLPD